MSLPVEYHPAPPPPGPRAGELPHHAGLELDAIVALAADLELPNYARTVDALLGGGANFGVDREAAAAILQLDPLADVRARAQRAFTHRVLRHALAQGVDQVLDLGCGIPSAHAVHDVVLGRDPAARVAYVDLDPVVVAHARDLVVARPTVDVVWGDLRSPGCVAAAVGDHLDLSRPVAVLIGGALQFVHDDVAAVLAGWRALLAPGSVLAATHGSTVTRDIVPTLDALYVRGLAGLVLRSPGQIREAFEVVGPAVDVVDWPTRGAGGSAATGVLGAVGTID